MIPFKHTVPIISGKGGVGKSTVAVNLAAALAREGAQVALIDADMYGPSIPTLMGGGSVIPDHEGRLIPPTKFGIKYISIGFFLEHPDQPIIWRGPMFNKALSQMFNDVNWGTVDYAIIDMPPGTGDAQISLAQMLSLSGAVVVTTPQEVALADVRKSINMLRKVNVDVLGIVENMAGFTAPDGTFYDIFGSGGGEKTAREFDTELLAQIPLDPKIREGGDAGAPIALSDSQTGKAFGLLAGRVIGLLDRKSADSGQGLRIVN